MEFHLTFIYKNICGFVFDVFLCYSNRLVKNHHNYILKNV